jgi:hypothetical protein
MEQADQELLRRMLMSIVKRIESGDSIPALVKDRPGQTSERTEPPVIIVMLGQAGPAKNEVCENHASHEAVPGSKTSSDMSHPGFERFQITGARAADVPKTCFMEPERICVNSGACEMLGH